MDNREHMGKNKDLPCVDRTMKLCNGSLHNYRGAQIYH